jgi:hypothetical protein
MSRSCDECSMCCKLLDIAEFNKPAHRWCPHVAKGGGCSIYDTRYDTCRGYACGWQLDETLGPEWRPNKSKFILHTGEGELGLWLVVDPSQPLAWKREPYYRQIKTWSSLARDGSGYVAISVGTRSYVVFPEEDLEVTALVGKSSIKVGYRHSGANRRPLVKVRDAAGEITEFLGAAVAA